MKLDFSVIVGYLPMFGGGLLVTLEVTFCSLFFALILSIPLSLCKISNVRFYDSADRLVYTDAPDLPIENHT